MIYSKIHIQNDNRFIIREEQQKYSIYIFVNLYPTNLFKKQTFINFSNILNNEMTEMILRQVQVNKSNGLIYVTIPRKNKLNKGETVLVLPVNLTNLEDLADRFSDSLSQLVTSLNKKDEGDIHG